MNIHNCLLRLLLSILLFSWAGCQGSARGNAAGGDDGAGDSDFAGDGGGGDSGGGDSGGGDSGGGGDDNGGGGGELLPSRLEGVAPLSVFFEPNWGSDTLARSSFHTARVEWDYGDEDAGTWVTTGASKNLHRGPLGAHVFEQPGTYVTTATLRTAAGDEMTQTATIVVLDPDEVFAGSSTVCVSKDGVFDGAPDGCNEVVASQISGAQQYIQPGMRILFRRGESWSGGGLNINVAGPGHVGAFGEGEDPILNTGGRAFTISGETPLADDWRITDFKIVGDTGATGVSLEGETNRLLIHNLVMRDVHVGVKASGSVLDYWSSQGGVQHNLHDGVIISEVDVRGIIGGSGGNGIFFVGGRTAVMGSHFEDSLEAEHILRMPDIKKGLIAHNYLAATNPQKHLLKLHAPLYSAAMDSYTEFVHISDNTFVGNLEDWPIAIGPHNAQEDQRVRDVMMERNHVIGGADNQVMTLFWAKNVTARNNVTDVSVGGARCFDVTRRGIEPLPSGVRIYNNTCYHGGSGSVTFVNMSLASDSVAYNNLVVATGGAATLGNVGENGKSNNVLSQTNFFVSNNPSTPVDFMPAQGSTPDGAGTPVDGLFDDFFGNSRSAAAPDVGALEN